MNGDIETLSIIACSMYYLFHELFLPALFHQSFLQLFFSFFFFLAWICTCRKWHHNRRPKRFLSDVGFAGELWEQSRTYRRRLGSSSKAATTLRWYQVQPGGMLVNPNFGAWYRAGGCGGMLGLGSGTGCCPRPLGGSLFLPGGRSCAYASRDRQPYDNVNTWLRGSGGLHVLVEGEGCAKCCALLVRNGPENIHFSWTLSSCLSHLHSLCVVKAPALRSSSMGREMPNAAVLPRRRKRRFGSWMWLLLLFLFSFFSKSLLYGKAMMGAQPPAPRGGARAESGAAAGRCRCFMHAQLEDWKTKIPFFASLEIFFLTNWKQKYFFLPRDLLSFFSLFLPP